jgi:transposase
MPRKLIPVLSDEIFQQLTDLAKHSPKPYLRERASAILKLADGQSASQIACAGLLQKRYYETVSDWFHRFQSQGVEGLSIKAGRGRKAAFSPSTGSITSPRTASSSDQSTA